MARKECANIAIFPRRYRRAGRNCGIIILENYVKDVTRLAGM